MLGPKLLHSVSYSGSWGQARLSMDEFIDKAAGLGYQGVLLMAKRPHLSPLDYDPAARALLRSRIESRGLQCVALAGYTNFTADLEHGEIPHREIQTSYVVELARLCRDLGGSVVRIFTGYENPVSGYTAQWNLIVAALKECARRVSDIGVTIGVQNHHDLGAHYEAQFDLICAVNEPNCKAIFDAWSPALHGTDLAAAAWKMAPVTCHTTAADYQKRPRFRYQPGVINYEAQTPWAQAVPMGEGFIDYAGFFKVMQANGYHGPAAYEMCSPLLGGGSIENLDRYARRFLEFLRKLGG